MISALTPLFTSHTKAQEIVLLLHDAKEVLRQGFYERELPVVEEFCRKNSLFLAKSKFKVILDDENHFTNKGLRLPETDPRAGMYFVYISKDEAKANLASYYELISDHRQIGLLLGYPECCVEFFCRNFSESNSNPQLNSTNVYTNISKRDHDVVLLSHFPCSSECEKSIELGKNYYKLLEKVEPERAAKIRSMLSC